jgi:putative tryptophan/tyrosine transport system substrate-binding protein
MRRREFIALVGSATAWAFAARAQQTGGPVIGFLSSRSPAESEAVVSAFRQGLGEAGYVAGQNVAIDYRWAKGNYDRLPALAAELIGLRVALIFAAGGPPSALAAKAATSSIPIVFSAVSDPVRLGLIASLGRPGGNVTGMSTFTADLGAKEVELLKELLPAIKTLVYLVNPTNPSGKLEAEAAVTAGGAAGIQVQVLNASTESELESVELRAVVRFSEHQGAPRQRRGGLLPTGGISITKLTQSPTQPSTSFRSLMTVPVSCCRSGPSTRTTPRHSQRCLRLSAWRSSFPTFPY